MSEQRLLTCLLVSFTLHTAFLAFLPPLLSRSDSRLKMPLWVDLVDLKEISSPKPTGEPSTPEPRLQKLQRPLAGPKTHVERSEEPPSPKQEVKDTPAPDSRSLPSGRDLIPTVNSLLGLQRAYENPLYVEPSLDSDQGIQRGRQYDAYLAEIKESVRKHWKVSGGGESKSGTTVIRILINPDGSLASVDLLQSSGMILHDYEALDAIKQSFPHRSPPPSLLDEKGKLSIRFSFHYFLAPPG